MKGWILKYKWILKLCLLFGYLPVPDGLDLGFYQASCRTQRHSQGLQWASLSRGELGESSYSPKWFIACFGHGAWVNGSIYIYISIPFSHGKKRNIKTLWTEGMLCGKAPRQKGRWSFQGTDRVSKISAAEWVWRRSQRPDSCRSSQVLFKIFYFILNTMQIFWRVFKRLSYFHEK